MPKVRSSKIFSFTVADLHGYLIVGEYEDGRPGELFISVAKMGSTLAGLMESFGRSISYGLQHGVPLKVYVKGLTSTAFAPSGITDDPDIRVATSIIDYVFRRMAKSYLSFDDQLELGLVSLDDMPAEQTSLEVETPVVEQSLEIPATQNVAPAPSVRAAEPSVASSTDKKDGSAPMCYSCGNQTQRSGSCYVCTTCGSTTGCS